MVIALVDSVAGEASSDNPASRLSTQEIYATLRRKIMEHEIPPATKINIHKIAKDLFVSPTPVREALRLLQGDNLLVATSNKGYATTALLNEEQVRSLFEFRLLIEPWAARMSAINALSNPASTLKAEIDGIRTGTKTSRHAAVAHDHRFHHIILKASGNANVLNAYEQSHCHLHLFRLSQLDTAWESVTFDEHRDIHDAIARHDQNGAEEAMRQHLHEAYRRFASHLTTTPNEPAALRDIPLGTIHATGRQAL